MNNLESLFVDKCFLGCGGLDAKLGMTSEIPNEAYINSQMIAHTEGKVYILADHSKLGKRSGFVSCPVKMVQNVITDMQAHSYILKEFRERGISVYQAH